MQQNARHLWGVVALLLVLITQPLRAVADEIDFHLTKIDQGVSWVSGYWGYNGPKLVYDGEYYYTVGSWGADQASSKGIVYRYDGTTWEKGYEWTDLNYQPALILLDSQKRLIIIYAKPGAKPRILRSNAPGDINNFTSLFVSNSITQAGYIGAGIHNNRLVIGYIGGADTYSFYTAIMNLDTQQWTTPMLHASAQQSTIPYTAWLYPIIQVNDTGFHMVASNAGTSSTYDRILYKFVPFNAASPPPAEIIAEVVLPPIWRIAFGMSMWIDDEGAIYVAGQFNPDPGNMLMVYRRDPVLNTWSSKQISTSQVAAVYQNANDPDNHWLMSTFGSSLRLYNSSDEGNSWQNQTLPSFAEYGLVSSFFLHGLNPGSGSVMPDKPTAVFSAGPHPNYQLWFVQFNTPAPGGDVSDSFFLH
jgi:hypothetical protein